MIKSISLAVGSVVFGAAAMIIGLRTIGVPPGWAPSNTVTAEHPPFQAQDEEADTHGLPFIRSMLSLYDAAAEIHDPGDLESAIRQITNLTSDRGREQELEVLLLRFVELDPIRAVRFAQDHAISAELVVSMFRAWASYDQDAALYELAATGDRALIRDVALDLVVTIGGTHSAIERLASLLSDVDRPGFISDAYVRFAEHRPQWALDEAIGLAGYRFRQVTAQRVGAAWAMQDPLAAIAQLGFIAEPELRHLVHFSVVTEWASIDPDRALTYLIEDEGRVLFSLRYAGILAVVSKLVAHRPFDVLAAAQNTPGPIGAQLQTAALRQIVSEDLSSAMGQLESMPTGQDRARLAQLVAEAYVRQDPMAALRWAQSVEHSLPETTVSVVREIARTDPVWAIDLALEHSGASHLIPSLVGMLASSEVILDGTAVGAVAERLLGHNEAVGRLVEIWASRDAHAAFEWMLDKGPDFDRAHVQRLARVWASNDFQQSAEAVWSLPPEMRSDWVVEVSRLYMLRDPHGAASWLESFRPEPGYDELISRAVENMMLGAGVVMTNVNMPLDPRHLVSLLESTQQPSAQATALVVAEWARDEPRAAARWAASISDTDAQSFGVAAAVGAWTVHDPTAAGQWARSLSDDAVRDHALRASVSQGITSHGSIDRGVLNAFSSDAERQRALTGAESAFVFLGSRAPALAMELVDLHIDDLLLRDRISNTIDRLLEDGVVFPADRTLSVVPLGAIP